MLGRFGQIGVLINSAAIDDRFGTSAAHDSMFEYYAVERWQRMLDANVTGTFLTCQTLGAAMLRGAPRDRSIVDIASTYGIVGPDQALYRRPDGSQAFLAQQAHAFRRR